MNEMHNWIDLNLVLSLDREGLEMEITAGLQKTIPGIPFFY